MAVPVWLLDIDGVINARTVKPSTSVWPAEAWNEGKAEADGHKWTIRWAEPVIAFIRNAHDSGHVEIRWHTTWQHHSSALADLVGLPEFPVADAPELDDKPGYVAKAIREARSWWWKLPAAERVVRDEARPLIWTDEKTGLTRKQLRQISDFIAHQRLAEAVANV